MNRRYIQPYANPQLNSCQQFELKATGNRDWVFAFNKDDFAGRAKFVYVLDEKRTVIDYDGLFFALDLQSPRTIGAPLKSSNTFIRLGEGQLLYLFSGFELVPLQFDRIQSDRIGLDEEESEGEETETEESDEPPRQRHYVPGLGEYSLLHCLYPDEKSFIAGIQGFGNPNAPQETFGLYEMNYGAQTTKWSWGFDGRAIVPPISVQGQAVVARTNFLTILSREGRVLHEIEGEFEPVACSIGPDNLIYLICNDESGTKLRIYNLWGELEREIDGVSAEPVQPPLVAADGSVYIIDGGKIAAFQSGQKVWTYPLLSGAPAATVSGDGNILIADGIRIICLDTKGEVIWTYEDTDGNMFITPPVIDQNGNVLAASDNVLVMLK